MDYTVKVQGSRHYYRMRVELGPNWQNSHRMLKNKRLATAYLIERRARLPKLFNRESTVEETSWDVDGLDIYLVVKAVPGLVRDPDEEVKHWCETGELFLFFVLYKMYELDDMRRALIRATEVEKCQ